MRYAGSSDSVVTLLHVMGMVLFLSYWGTHAAGDCSGRVTTTKNNKIVIYYKHTTYIDYILVMH